VTAIVPIAWRNLWRNRRRTFLTAGGIAFAVALLSFAIAQQLGTYAIMIDNATGLLTGHLQIQRVGYRDDPRVESTVPDAAALRERVAALPGARVVTERVEAFVLVSAGERSFAGQLLGVDPDRERETSTLPELLASGRYLIGGARDSESDGPSDGVTEAYAGEALARNLGVDVGGEIVILGTDRSGGVAAMVTRLVGTFATGQPEIDRALIEVPIDAVRNAFALGDEASALVIRAKSAADATLLAESVGSLVPPGCELLGWQQLIPELQQTIDLDRTSGMIFYGLLALIVTFSIVNSFAMLIYERTREFGVLLAIGMRPWHIVGMLQLEAIWLAALGIAGGLAVALPAVAWFARVGLPLGESSGALLERFHMPDRLYGAFALPAFLRPTVLMATATVLAALIPSLRVRRLRPVEALRAE